MSGVGGLTFVPPGTGSGSGSGTPPPSGGGGNFWDGLKTSWANFKYTRARIRDFKNRERVGRAPGLRDEIDELRLETTVESQRNQLEAARDARAKAGAARITRATKMAILAGTAGGAITKDSVAVYDSPALRKITLENPFLDPNKRQNLTALKEASAHTTKDLRQYTAGTESMRGLNVTSDLPAKDALMVSGKMKSYNMPAGSMKELNSPEVLIKNRPDFTMQRMNTPIKLNRLRNAGNPGSMSGMPITNPPPQPRLQQAINSSVPVFNLQSLKIRDIEGGETPLARMSTKNLTIKPPIGNTPINGPALNLQSGLSLQVQPRKLLAKPKSSSNGFDNSYYKRNMSKFRKELR